uniref:Coat protein n=1 Tax=Pineapple mealybug wilt-associated virus 3 TaxID=373861 RepID=B6E527_9CLOS|nr:coat protein [Pineapple mealybug wilt-associated virus 3]
MSTIPVPPPPSAPSTPVQPQLPKADEEQLQEIENLPLPGGRTTVNTFTDLISSNNAVLDFTKVEVPRMINITIPGIVAKEHRVKGAKALWELGKSKGISESDKHMIQFLMQSFQSFVTHSTSPKVSGASNRTITAKYDNKDVPVSHEELKTTLDNSLASYGYEITMRQFGRAFTTAIVQGLRSGKMEVNTRICSSHGIPPNYYPYSPDCLHVDARIQGYDAALANELGKMVALNKNAGGKRTQHNLFQETDISPQIFTGNRR